MAKTKKATLPKKINKDRRAQLEYFGKAAAAIAGMSLIPTLATSAVSFKKGAGGASTLWLGDTGNVGINTSAPGTKLEVVGGHVDSQIRLRAATGVAAPNDSSYINIWASEPGVTYTGAGIGNNIINSSTSPYFVRQNTARGGSYIRLLDNEIRFYTANSSGALLNGASLDGNGYLTATRVYGAVWNDIADYFEIEHELEIEFGKVYVRTKTGETRISLRPCEKGILGIASDTYGMSVGKKGKGKKELPIALAGIVLAHCDKEYEPGTPLTATRDGLVTKMYWWEKFLFPERLVATYYKPEAAKKWNGVSVNNRHWVKIQ